MNIDPLVLIPARGGSKGIPKKNIKLLKGRPLIYYTIDAAKELFADDQICVSTDSDEIANIVTSYPLAVPFIRPSVIASDSSGMYEVILHALSFFKDKGRYFDTVILLQPTTPLRTGQHIKEALSLYDSSCDMVASVKQSKANPYFTLREEDENGWLQQSKKSDFVRRQDCPPIYELNGAIYIMRVTSLKSTPPSHMKYVKKYVMDDFSSIDLDSPLDWSWLEFLIETR